MRQKNSKDKKTANAITIICGLLFLIFSFSYTYSFQSDLIANIQGVLSQWKNIYSPLGGAIVITVVLYLLQIGLNYITRWKNFTYAFSFLPSCLILGIITSFNRGIYSNDFSLGTWLWLSPTILIAYFLIAVALRFIPNKQSNKSILTMLNVNILILIFLCLGTLYIGNTDLKFHAEMKMERLIKSGQYMEASHVAAKSLESSREMTVLRNYALSRADSIGEKIFEYPQDYRTKGLLFDDHNRTTYLQNNTLFAYLGGKPMDDESTVSYLERLCNKNTGSHNALDYFLCALLLDRQLEYFSTALDTYYEEGSVLYKHYQEALYLYKYLHKDYELPFDNPKMTAKFNKFQNLRKQYAYDEQIQKNYTRREFGNTYWWYYIYGE